MEARDILLRPLVTEKTNADMQAGKYWFIVDMRANRTEIKRAVEEVFKVKVVSVNTMVALGKMRRLGRFEGKRPDYKKAVVQLAEGQRITLFEGA
jgi:large subunit ribosomal protein L23